MRRLLLALLLVVVACPAEAQDCPARLAFTNTLGATDMDLGWTGFAHDVDVQSDSTITLDVTSCAGSAPSCGICTVTGPIQNQGANAGTIASQRCYADPSTRCTVDADCTDTCVFYFGGPMPIAAGGVATCVLNTLPSVTGTVNVDTSDLALTAVVTSRVFQSGTITTPCPPCVGDSTANDGSRGGTCEAGARAGLACDTVGVHPLFGGLSLDCPPLGGPNGTLALSLPVRTASTSVTLAAGRPDCTAAGFGALGCSCDTCATAAAEPCRTDGECPATTTCGGMRCLGGGSVGQPCAAHSDCPGSVCGTRGEPTKPNACSDVTCTATTNDEGVCVSGPFEGFCVLDTFRGCLTQSDCLVPGDSCAFAARRCFPGTGTLGDTVSASGAAAAPVGTTAVVTLAALFCVGTTGGGAIDATTGLPGLGRLEMGGTLEALPPSTTTRRVIVARSGA